MEQHGLLRSDADMSVFIKVETSSNGTDPRNISPRSARFLSILGPFVSAIEHAAVQCQYLVKGLNPEDRGARISDEWRHSVIETDFSRFDMTVSTDIIETVERMMFRRAFPKGLYPDLDVVLDLLMVMKGVSAMGVQYSVAGTRASGDAHTSIANGVINRFAIWACLRNIDPSTWVSFHEGDDGVIHCDQHVTQTIVDYLPYAGFLGFKLKIVTPPSHAQAVFCGRFTCPDCFRERCDLPRALAKFHTSFKQGEPQSLVLAKALSYFATDSHTPIMGRLCWSLIQLLSPRVSARLYRRRLHSMHWYDRQRVKRGEAITSFDDALPCCRASVQLVHGWCTALQVEFEEQLETWARGVTNLPPLQVDDHLVDNEDMVIYQAL